MNRLIYYFVYSLLWLLAWLPLSIQFFFSNILFLLVYRVVAYRKKVVRENIRNSFPEKGKKERLKIERQFYRHFCDSFFEWMYPLHRSASTVQKRYKVANAEVINDLYHKGKSVAGVLGHYGNWEFLSTLPYSVKHKVWAIYKPIKNEHFDGLMNGLRSKYGVHMVPDKSAFKTLLSESQKGETTLTYFLADQSPQKDKIRYWTRFLNQDTPVFLGAEQMATKLDMAVVFFDIRKERRGHYSLHFELLAEHPKWMAPHEITELHVRALERAIQRDPAWWLWSHKRWKHKMPAPSAASSAV